MHSPKDPSFVQRNRLPDAVQVFATILDESGIGDWDTAKADMRYLDEDAAPWVGGECDFFTEALEGKGVSGYLEGFERVLKARGIKTWLGLVPLIEEIRVNVPGLDRLRVPQVCLDLQKEADLYAAHEQEQLVKGTGVEAEDVRQTWGTPQDLFDVLHAEYRFSVDCCASPYNHKLDRFWTRDDDAFAQDVSKERLWCNPPSKDVPSWIGLCAGATFAALLLPVRSDREWWRIWKPKAEVHYFIGESPHRRIQFVAPPGVKPSSNPGSYCLFLLGSEAAAGVECYRSGLTGERL